MSNGEGEGGGARLAAELFTLIRDRRSIRAFSDRAVPPEMIAQIVDCGLAAPSSKNSNPWFIVTAAGERKRDVVTWFRDAVATAEPQSRVPIDPATGRERAGLRDTVQESAETVEQASVLILLFNRAPFSRGVDTLLHVIRGNTEGSLPGKALYGYAGELIALGAAVENMLLAARALGLGAVYMADSYPLRERIRREMQTTRELVGMLAVGWPTYGPPPRELRREFSATWEDAVGRIDASVLEREAFWVSDQ